MEPSPSAALRASAWASASSVALSNCSAICSPSGEALTPAARPWCGTGYGDRWKVLARETGLDREDIDNGRYRLSVQARQYLTEDIYATIDINGTLDPASVFRS